jgi:predicted O-methyltransferase YrrM
MSQLIQEGKWLAQSLISVAKKPDAYTLKNLPYWFWSLTPLSTPIKDQVPFITFTAREFLEPRLTQKMRVFEFGPGGSTFYFAKRVKEVICAEHDPVWYNIMNENLQKRQVNNCTLLLCAPEQLKSVPKYSPTSNTSEEFKHNTLDFTRYTTSIAKYPNGYFDLILVDGRARPSCINQAISKVKKGGYLILDNSERKAYACAFPLLKKFKRKDFSGLGPRSAKSWRTTIWVKK